MLRTLLGACLAAGLLAGCSSHPEIPVSDQQALVMESSVLAAGISASEPAVVATEIQATASSTLYNERQQPVTVHYRFFWYDARGLEMHPLDAPRTIVVPARSSVTLYGSANLLVSRRRACVIMTGTARSSRWWGRCCRPAASMRAVFCWLTA